MLVIAYGMIKSASTFSFQLIRDLLYTSGFNQFKIKERYLPSDWRWADGRGIESSHNLVSLKEGEIYTINQLIPKDEVIVLKTHSAPNKEVVSLIASGEAVASVSLRDPAECLLSLMNTAKAESEREGVLKRFSKALDLGFAAEMINNSVNNTNAWLDIAKVIPVPYGSLIHAPDVFVSEIAERIHCDVGNKNITDYYQDRSKILEYGCEPYFNNRIDEFPDLASLNCEFNLKPNQPDKINSASVSKQNSLEQEDFPKEYWLENLLHLSGILNSKRIISEAKQRLKMFDYTDQELSDLELEGRALWGL